MKTHCIMPEILGETIMYSAFPYKYETHCHTSEVSACASNTAEEIVKSYAKAGYSGVIITDHFFNGNCNIDAALPWKDKVDLFCIGYENAKKVGDRLNIDIFFGWEYNYKGIEFLTYGLDKKFLLDNPDLLEWPLELYFDKVHEANGFLTHAHPFRERSYIKKIRLFGKKIDAIEVFNSGNDKQIFNERALAYAQEFGLPQTAGSDTHNVKNLAGQGTYFPERLKSINEFIKYVKNGKSYISIPED